METRKSRTKRWWPLLLLPIVASVVMTFIQMDDVLPRQQKNMRIALTGIVAFVLLFLWMLFLSRMKWALRLGITGGCIGLVSLAAATLKVEGVSGDLLPILTWRWRPLPSERATEISDVQGSSLADDNEPVPPDHIADYPQFLGPRRTGIVAGPTFATNWKEHPPRELWRHPLGPAWSAFAVKGLRAVTQEQRGDEEWVTCYHLLNGTLLWSQADDAHHGTVLGGEGPRATPSIDEGLIFALGATGILNCLALKTGERIWQRNIREDANAPDLEWGYAGSPLVADDLVIVNAGGGDNTSMTAYRKSDGGIVWSNGGDPASYSAPFLTTLLGRRQILIFHQDGLTSHDEPTGEILWSFPIRHDRPHVAVPLVFADNRVMISSGYGYGSVLLEITAAESDGFSVQQIWKSKRMQAKFNNPVQKEGYVYGMDDGTLACLEATTGKRLWKEGRYGHGQMILANETQLLLTTETGGVVLIEPSPQGRRVLAELQVFDDKLWNPPALAGDLLLLRNHKEAVCYRLPVAGTADEQ